jgi:hypothetical protein
MKSSLVHHSGYSFDICRMAKIFAIVRQKTFFFTRELVLTPFTTS